MRLARSRFINFCCVTADELLFLSLLLAISCIPGFHSAVVGYTLSGIFSSTDMMIEFDR